MYFSLPNSGESGSEAEESGSGSEYFSLPGNNGESGSEVEESGTGTEVQEVEEVEAVQEIEAVQEAVQEVEEVEAVQEVVQEVEAVQEVEKVEVEERDGVEVFYPVIMENLEVRWAFLKKLYTILAIQMLLMVAVASTVVFVPPVANFFVTTLVGFVLYIFSLILPFIALCGLYFCRHRYHPFNLLLLGVFTVAMSFAVGLTCAFIKGEIILESLILTSVVVISLTMYTFWAAKRDHLFFQFLFHEAAVIILAFFILIEIFFALQRTYHMIFGALASLIFCVYIIYDTNNLMERYSYDEYVWAAVALNSVDIINFFLVI